MKILKTLGVLTVGYTIGEFFTGWRYQGSKVSFKEYTHTYFGTIPQQWDAATKSPDTMTGTFKSLWFDKFDLN